MTTSMWKSIFTYETCEATFNRRKKGSEVKPIMRGAILKYNEVKDEYIVAFSYYSGKQYDLVSINKDNVATVLGLGDTISHRNRLSALFKWDVYSDVANHRTKVNKIRMQTKKYKWVNVNDGWERVVVDVMPSISNTIDSIPCNIGMQIKMDKEGKIEKILNYKGDLKKLLIKKAVAEAKRKLANVRKVVMVMIKMGSFDEVIVKAMSAKYSEWDNSAIDRVIAMPEEITGYEAEQIIKFALGNMNIPWRATLDLIKPQVFETSMKLLREQYYNTVEGCYEYVES